MSFVFYDTETTGTHTAFDQILQFGAIRTDDQLRELERFEVRCRVLPYIVPAPGAMRVTGVSVDQLTDSALPSHYEMVCQIRKKLLDWSPSLFIGHNSMGFDEPLLRQALYKSLHNPYLTNTSGNGRTDSLRMLQAVALFAPGTVVVPENDNGRPVFKLDQLAPANGFAHENAHDAMADVEATIHMCRLVAERAPAFWENFTRFARKAPVSNYVMGEDVICLTDFYYARPYSWIVTAIVPNPQNSSEILVFDLAKDPAELMVLSDEALVAGLRDRPRAVRGLRANAAPIIQPYDAAPQDLRDHLPDLAELQRRAAIIKTDRSLRNRLVTSYLAAREPREPSSHVEERIYDGFISSSDQVVLDRFHVSDWSERLAILGSLGNERLRALGNRLVYSDAPQIMPDAVRREYDLAIARRLLAEPGSVPWLTLPQALTEAEDLLTQAEGEEAILLRGHRDRLQQQVDWALTMTA